MSFDRSRRAPATGARAAASPTAPGPGKQTLVQQLAAPVQRRASPDAAPDGPGVHAAAAHGTSGAATALPFRDQIQRSFGRHDVGRVQAHLGGAAAEGAGAMGAHGFAVGEHVAFGAAPDLHTAAHEAAHVVQQRGGVHLKGGVGEAGDPYERHADAVADLVVQGVSSEALLDQHAGQPDAAAPSGAVQRLAFVNGKQIRKADPIATGDVAVARLITDPLVRDYEDRDELQRHAAGKTDYLGNLPDKEHTWIRFHPTGLNILGEIHTSVTLHMLTHAVGTTNFIGERLSRDHLAEGTQLKTAYDKENAAAFQDFGIAGESDKQPHGAESLFPKLGAVLTRLLPYFDGTQDLAKISTSEGYAGIVGQRYLKLAWAHGKDLKTQVAVMQGVGRPTSPVQARLALAIDLVAPELDGFLTALPVDGFLGDHLVGPEAHDRLLQLAIFARAFIDAMVERAIADPSSRLKPADKARLAGGNTNHDKIAGPTPDDDKAKMFDNWRNFQFEDSVREAAGRGVRYAGMGWNHFNHLRDKTVPPAGSHLVDMTDKVVDFKDATQALEAKAVKP
ncbi:MAG TPA: DUF4157 domain-containing protein [Kofleriaceae bacterium]|nr:DUF4157 domain-containing protein [Kofleriaceae bacterium]